MIMRQMNELPAELEAHTDGDVVAVLDFTPDDSLLSKRTARELVNRFQKLRKKAGLQPADAVDLFFSVESGDAAAAELAEALAATEDVLKESLGSVPAAGGPPGGAQVIDTEQTALQLPSGASVDIVVSLVRPGAAAAEA